MQNRPITGRKKDKPIKLKQIETKNDIPPQIQTTKPATTLNEKTTENINNNTEEQQNNEQLVINIGTSSELPPMSQTTNNFNKNKKPFHTQSYFNQRRALSSLGHREKTTNSNFKMFLIPSIPSSLLDRIKLNIELFKNPQFIEYYNKCPPRISTSFDNITNYLYKYKSHFNELDHYAMFYYYLCHQFNFDVKNINKDNHDINSIFQSGVANNFQFCKLFEYMCKLKRMRFKRIDGFCKGMVLPHFKAGTEVTGINHSWEAIMVKGEWYFLDLTFGSGGIKPKSEFLQEYFNPYYFLTPSEYLIESHRPIDDDWQMTKKTVTIKQFGSKRYINLGDFYQKVYEYEVDLISHPYPIIHSMNKDLSISFALKNNLVQANLFMSNFKTKLSECKFSFNQKKNIFNIEPNFPGNGDYILQILARPITSTDLVYLPLMVYKIKIDDSQLVYLEMMRQKKIVMEKLAKEQFETSKKRPRSVRIPQTRIITDYNTVLPNKLTKKICFDNKGAYLLEPKSQIVKIGIETKFKVRMKDANAAVILDGKKWNYLKKKDEDIWEGKVTVQTENVTLCALKPCNVFTEVFNIKTQYPTASLLMLTRSMERLSKGKK